MGMVMLFAFIPLALLGMISGLLVLIKLERLSRGLGDPAQKHNRWRAACAVALLFLAGPVWLGLKARFSSGPGMEETYHLLDLFFRTLYGETGVLILSSLGLAIWHRLKPAALLDNLLFACQLTLAVLPFLSVVVVLALVV